MTHRTVSNKYILKKYQEIKHVFLLTIELWKCISVPRFYCLQLLVPCVGGRGLDLGESICVYQRYIIMYLWYTQIH